MTLHRQINEVPAQRRGLVSRLNDDSLEYVILGLRMLTVLGVLAVIASLAGLIWTWDVRWFLTFCLGFTVTMACGLLGFRYFANEEWPWVRR